MTHIPYRGAAPAFNDLIPGRVDVMFNLITSSLPLIRSGQIRGLAVATPERAAVLPDVADDRGIRRCPAATVVMDRAVRAGEDAAPRSCARFTPTRSPR